MADTPIVHIGENSQEQVAYKLLRDIARQENKLDGYNSFTGDRQYILDTYAEALDAVKGSRSYSGKK